MWSPYVEHNLQQTQSNFGKPKQQRYMTRISWGGSDSEVLTQANFQWEFV